MVVGHGARRGVRKRLNLGKWARGGDASLLQPRGLTAYFWPRVAVVSLVGCESEVENTVKCQGGWGGALFLAPTEEHHRYNHRSHLSHAAGANRKLSQANLPCRAFCQIPLPLPKL